ncbi:MAG: polyprenyl synthetase family protein [Acidobacteria bacterium]|nr:polyprenyl synthetase family protein [Acidobacteriota bacterium]
MPAPAAAAPGRVDAAADFALLMDGFRARLDREITTFLAAKRAAAVLADLAGRAAPAAPATPAAPAPEGDLPDDLRDLRDLVGGVGRLMSQGGKRLRPALVYFTYRACGGRSDQQVMPLALAVEFLHTYLLIHDDIMDHAEVRRGQPAAHARFRGLHRAGGLRGDADDFGRSAAILLGDLAHTYAVELFTGVAVRPGVEPAGGAPPAGPASRLAPRWVELNRCFSQMCEEVIAGQYLEYLLAHRGQADRPAPRESELLRVLRLKSGRYTAERPIQLGALLAGASEEQCAELSRYGTAVGEAFQLQDDLLGIFGDPATVGKPVGDDLREGKFTLLIHHALVHGSDADRQLVAGALGDRHLGAAAVAQVQEALERTGARRAVTAMIAGRLAAARQALAALAQQLPLAQPLPPAAASTGSTAGAERPGNLFAAEGLRFLAGLLDYLWEREQ